METSTASTTPPIDWQALQRLVEQSAYPPERLTRLQQQLAVRTAPAEGRLTLLVGQPVVVDLFISRWLSPDLLDGLSSAGVQPLVLGRRPDPLPGPESAPVNLAAAPVNVPVEVVELLGHELHLYLNSGKNSLVGTVDPRFGVHTGNQIQVVFDMDNVHLFDKATELAIR
mgnify:CR=1 FL=1